MEFEFITICFIVIMVNMTERCACAGSLRILGGRDARAGEFPYVVSIELIARLVPGFYQHSMHCTGSVLTATATLTAAHCCDHYERLIRLGVIDLAAIRYGSATGKLSKDNRFNEILSCARQPSQRPVTHPAAWDDLALLRTRPIALPSYARLSALDHRLLFGQRVLILGYGLTNRSDGAMLPTVHLEKPLQVTDAMWSKCERYRQVNQPYPGVCAVMACGRPSSACQGDSGGPLLHSSGVIAVSARAYAGLTCHMRSENRRPSEAVIAVPLSPYIDWIVAVVKEFSKFGE